MSRHCGSLIYAFVLLPPVACLAAQPNPSDGSRKEVVRRRVVELVEQLDSEAFDARLRASCRLEGMAAQPDMKSLLAEVFEEILVQPETSFEVRKQLQQLRHDLPAAAAAQSKTVSDDQIDGLIRLLEDNSYAARLGATRRLEWLLENPALIGPVFLRLQTRLADANLPADTQKWLEPIYDRAWGAWLLSDLKDGGLPAVSAEQISRWIDDLVKVAGAPDAAAARRAGLAAQRALRGALARQQCVSEVKTALEARLAAPKTLGPEAAARLEQLLDLVQPAMVAEYWEGDQHTGTQYLLVGVPSVNPGGVSHFDRIDDQTAHCTSGVNLAPGDYPVGVAFPHPYQEGAFFRLVNLPTPRRRMAYPYELKLGEAARLRRITQRTIECLLARKQPLSESELVMLDLLDAREVSRSAGRLFQTIQDQRLPVQGPRRTGGRPSHHGMICGLLAYSGSREAAAGLLDAIDENRFLPPAPDAPYCLPWIAALAIAQRDPWTEADQWLVGLLERKEALVENQPKAPELAATATAILLKHHGEDPSEFGLESVEEALFSDIDLSGYRFASAEATAKVKQWWVGHSASALSSPPDH